MLAVCLFGFTYYPGGEIAKLRNMNVENIQLDTVADGVYRGDYRYGVVLCTVEIVVREHRITAIHIINNGRSVYAKRAEEVSDRVLEAQSLQVDVISGATTTSKALLKAMEKALTAPPSIRGQ